MELYYKGFLSRIYFAGDAALFHGEVLDVDDLIVFQGRTLEEAVGSMEEAIDDYLAYNEVMD